MTDSEKLEALFDEAVKRGWDGRGCGFKWIVEDRRAILEWALFWDGVYAATLFNHDFARALFGGVEVPNEEEIDQNHSRLGLFSAEGGGYEGYGDYVYLNFEGESWQYYLQQAVISDDPIGYMYGVVFDE